MNYPDIEKFSKQHDYLICIDSDGTAIDAMNVKHRKCHGPSFIEEWGLEDRRNEIQKIWDKINLFSSTRGVNRFIALVEILEKLDGKYLEVEGLDVLKNWVDNATELSNKCLKDELQRNNSIILKKAFDWSTAVNRNIAKLTANDKKPFEGVLEFLECAFAKVDLAVVSSSNMDAILEEWKNYDMLKFISVMTSQEIGTKGECISKMIRKGYDTNRVLMVGDANPDLEAAKENGVFYYPVLTEHEKESWDMLSKYYLDKFLSGNYGKYQEKVLNEFYTNFNKL